LVVGWASFKQTKYYQRLVQPARVDIREAAKTEIQQRKLDQKAIEEDAVKKEAVRPILDLGANRHANF